jgi:hypothetical protein
MYYNVMPMTVMVLLNSCALKENQDDRYDQCYCKYMAGAKCAVKLNIAAVSIPI